MSEFSVRAVDASDREWVAQLITKRWGAEFIVAHHQVYHCRNLPGFVAVRGRERAGLLTYVKAGDECEVVSLDSLHPCRGIGTALLDAIKGQAVQSRCKRLWLVTTNDNMNALRFYQKRGFTLVKVNRNAIESARKLKPVPLIGAEGIPLQDEIELEMMLDSAGRQGKPSDTVLAEKKKEFFEYCPSCGRAGISFAGDKELRCRSCSFTYFHNVAAAVAAILEFDGRIILIRRSREPGKGKLDLPGGFADPGENAEEAIAREVKEELHIDIGTVTYSGSWPNVYEYKGVTYRTCDLFFHSKIDALPADCDPTEVAELVLLAPAEILLDQIAFQSTRLFLTRFIEEQLSRSDL